MNNYYVLGGPVNRHGAMGPHNLGWFASLEEAQAAAAQYRQPAEYDDDGLIVRDGYWADAYEEVVPRS